MDHIRHRVSIQERPAEIEARTTPGHWEGDLMLFARYGQALLITHERCSRLLLVNRQPNKAAAPVARHLLGQFGPLPPSLRQSLTFDNGTEFALHYQLNRQLGMATYFCDPHAPWQKGGIENAIGRMRRLSSRNKCNTPLSWCCHGKKLPTPHVNRTNRVISPASGGMFPSGHCHRPGALGGQVSRELKRNSQPTKVWTGGYAPARAQQLAERRRHWDGRFKLARQPTLQIYVRERLIQGWSPEQIAGRLTAMKAATRISHESIYRFIYDQVRRTNDGSWRHYLPRARGKRWRRRRSGRSVDDLIKGRVPIALRPPRSSAGTPSDTGKPISCCSGFPARPSCVSQERKSRALLLARQPGKAAVPTVQRLLAWFQAIHPRLRRTITFDNGTEFAEHLVLTEHLRMRTFFCDPYSPWQKGAVENAIGRLRRFLPRKTNLTTPRPTQLHACVAAYNNTPRKCLGFKTPAPP